MSRVEDRTVHTPSSILDREGEAASESLESETQSTYYTTLPLKPTRTIAVVVRRVSKIAPRPYRIDEPE